ncbi:AAA family ATPase [Staphylococcus haemolyticus]|uniref:AAA family ATPase n=1 Tax=Staphylococcus haemolyticus TaxID=1283 RepID=UPI00069D50DB|nr:AAA family ATPase [Staphylococcus haemolyticus]
MTELEWAHGDGSIIKEEHDTEYYKNSNEDIHKILLKSLNQNYNNTNLKVHEKNSEILISDEVVYCVKNVTPGGRPKKYPNEFRIQQNASSWTEAYELAYKNDLKGILLGVYNTKDLDSPIYCTWKLHSSPKKTSLSKQVRSEVIAKAINKGFAQQRTKNEYVCVFREEFIFFYIENYNWLHEKPLEEIQNKDDNYNLNISSNILGINKIYFGVPGTGKSYQIKEFIKNNGVTDYENGSFNENVLRITLHPEFNYNDFVGQIMPVVEEGVIEYKFKPGIFTKALNVAFEKRKLDEPVFLIMEEMNRSNIASVFGDLFQLLDRDNSGVSEYAINNSLIANEVFDNPDLPIFIPENLFIVGTVNLNDQNVSVMDTAFKRRFEFEYVSVDVNSNLNNYHFSLKIDNESFELNWCDFITTLNEFIVTPEEHGGLGLNEDKQIGQFFIKFTKDEIYNWNQITGKLLQYLWHDVESVSFSANKLFKEDIKSFGNIYSLAKRRHNFFSDIFINKIKDNSYYDR